MQHLLPNTQKKTNFKAIYVFIIHGLSRASHTQTYIYSSTITKLCVIRNSKTGPECRSAQKIYFSKAWAPEIVQEASRNLVYHDLNFVELLQ